MPSGSIQIAKQLALFLANKPGMLIEVCEVLAKAKINIYAICTSDTIDHSVVRLIVDNPKKALALFEEYGTLVVENEVIMIEGSNKPGSLSSIATLLAKNKVNIEYAYCATSPNAKQGLLILRPSQVAKALKVLNTRTS
ncbi:MAG: amino acid-binding protein [Verrucomicrobiota bacterium]